MPGHKSSPACRPAPTPVDAARPALAGLLAGAGAFLLWGLLPLYWRELAAVPASEIVAHRIMWSALLLLPLLASPARRAELAGVFRRKATQPAAGEGAHRVDWGTLGRVVACAVLIGGNWGTYVWAINDGRILEASLGYFVNPLFSVLLGALLLRERLEFLQKAAVALAALGVAVSIGAAGIVPWAGLVLAGTFAFYGLFRKTVRLSALSGLLLETLVLLIPAVAWLVWLHTTGQGSFFGVDAATRCYLVGTGLITCIPFGLFACATQTLPLSGVGLLQYLSPTTTFILGVTAFGEPCGWEQLGPFACIWVALALHSVSLLRHARRH